MQLSGGTLSRGLKKQVGRMTGWEGRSQKVKKLGGLHMLGVDKVGGKGKPLLLRTSEKVRREIERKTKIGSGECPAQDR